ncbi:MAG: hypothetical protein AAGH15_16020, partial [Myxococcota bacterium]
MKLGWGKIAVLTGRLPTTPRTRSGEPVMDAAEARYWSITGYDTAFPDEDGYGGAAVHVLMDEDVVVDAEGRYVIVFSREFERPVNATAENGVTWVNWGPTAHLSWTIRWLSVAPDWKFEFSPDEALVGWRSDWAAEGADVAATRTNAPGVLGDYQPIVHTMSTWDFSALGENPRLPAEPVWRDE